jgi:hypothetical protein
MKCAICTEAISVRSVTITSRFLASSSSYTINLCIACTDHLIGAVSRKKLQHTCYSKGWVQEPLPL